MKSAGLAITVWFMLLFVFDGDSHVLAADWSKVTVSDGTNRHVFTVELAVTMQQQQRGMMYRQNLAPNAGMLFVYKNADDRSYWMRNVVIPLDIIFIGPDGKVINIVARAEPQTDTPRLSEAPAIAVLEIYGGRAEELGITAGYQVDHPAIRLAIGRAADAAR